MEKVGAGAAGIEVGDDVFGVIDFRRDGADAEFVAVRADELVPKPARATHAEAAAVPLSALTAWQALFDQGDLAPGHRVLVHGGGGGVGSFAVQLARWRGARVTATSSARDADLVHGLGADDVIDYRTQRFEDVVADLDLVFDTVGGDTWERSWDVLGPRGRLVSIAVPRPPERATDDDRRAIWFIVKQDREQLLEIAGLIDAGHLRPIVSAELPLVRGQEAYGPTGHQERAGQGRPARGWRVRDRGGDVVDAARPTDRYGGVIGIRRQPPLAGIWDTPATRLTPPIVVRGSRKAATRAHHRRTVAAGTRSNSR